MLEGKKLYCDCCAKQIVEGSGTPTEKTTYGPVMLLGVNLHACHQCSQDPLVRREVGL